MTMQIGAICDEFVRATPDPRADSPNESHQTTIINLAQINDDTIGATISMAIHHLVILEQQAPGMSRLIARRKSGQHRSHVCHIAQEEMVFCSRLRSGIRKDTHFRASQFPNIQDTPS
ncbi:hypothetical protein PILCRDRAFT_87348 [Piloderma croceum F 1598]|uniref:Uncharacterized protein n=1 Tax=Piloderma croceum (strain F 1598) TaxID=765440 RepID=A0A0C3G346_PILCF|nr:hypothetical protein PILCRDRAFT_87348 [Piloderma croceum F 1598]